MPNPPSPLQRPTARDRWRDAFRTVRAETAPRGVALGRDQISIDADTSTSSGIAEHQLG